MTTSSSGGLTYPSLDSPEILNASGINSAFGLGNSSGITNDGSSLDQALSSLGSTSGSSGNYSSLINGLIGGGLGAAMGGSNSAGNSNTSLAGILQNAFGTAATSKNPAWENAAAESAYNSAATAASQPYTPYTGQLVAPKANNQMTASQLANNNVGRFANTYGQTQTDLNNAATPYTQTFSPTQVNPQNVQAGINNQQISTLPSWTTPGTAQQYMNPYTASTLQPQLNDLNNSFAQQQNQLNGNAASAGAFGGSRQGLLNTQLTNQQNEATQNLTNQAYSTAYNTGQTAYQNAQNTNLQAQNQQTGINQANINTNLQGQLANQSTGLNAGEYNSGMGLNAYNTNYNDVTQGNRSAALNAASGENSLVGTQQGVTNANIGNLASTGQVSQTTAQNQDTANYGQFLNQLYYPEQQASYLNTFLKGSPATNSISSAGNNGVANATSAASGGSSNPLSSLGSIASAAAAFAAL